MISNNKIERYDTLYYNSRARINILISRIRVLKVSRI